MISKVRILLLVPILMAMQCDEDEVPCVVEFTHDYSVAVENINETYPAGETIWLNAEVSSELDNSCNNNQPEVVFDRSVFATGFFVLKLTNELFQLNAELVQNVNVTYNLGDELSSIYCVEFIYFLPELSEDNSTYNYRIGISIDAPGDYCVVPAFRNNFDNLQQENNEQIFEAYNSLDDDIKFTSCNNTYTRSGTDGQYFFSLD